MSGCPQPHHGRLICGTFLWAGIIAHKLNRKPARQGWNKDVVSAGEGGNCPFSLSPSTLKKSQEKRPGAVERKPIHRSKRRHNTKDFILVAMNIKSLRAAK